MRHRFSPAVFFIACALFVAGCSGQGGSLPNTSSSGPESAPLVARAGIVGPVLNIVPPDTNAWPAEQANASWKYQTIDYKESSNGFNQLLGIDNTLEITGYYGDGTSLPNKGYSLVPPYSSRSYTMRNFPHSWETQVTGLDGAGDYVGWWGTKQGAKQYGWINWNGRWESYQYPHVKNVKVNQFLGMNSKGYAVGFYTDKKNRNHGYLFDSNTNKYSEATVKGGFNLTLSGINQNNDISGFYQITGTKKYVSFIYLTRSNKTYSYEHAGSKNTQIYGINRYDDVVGSYVDGSGKMHGFLIKDTTGKPVWYRFDAPKGKGTTVVNGLNDKDAMVGFYNDKSGKTHGLYISP